MADCKALAATLRRDLIRPLVLFNFGEEKRIPLIRFDCEEDEDLMQTANVVGALVEKTGLPVPLSYLYKKFSIPEPEDGEAIAVPSYTQQAAGPVFPFKAQPRRYVALKGKNELGTQAHIDRVTEAALKRGAGSWRKAFAPVLALLEQAESLEQLRDTLEDEEAVAELYASMDVSEVEYLLQKVMTLADLEGRLLEYGRD